MEIAEIMEASDTKDHKLQDQAQRQQMQQTPENCPAARRAKRMKCEVGVVDESLKDMKPAEMTVLHIH